MRLSALSALTTAAFLTTSALAGGAGAPATGGGQVQAATPAAVAAILRAAGFTVTMNPSDPDKDPSMTVRQGDSRFDVWLSGCKAGSCARVTASSSWDYSDQDELDTGIVNDWNANYYTQAYTYEGSYYLDSTMPLRGGYTAAALKAWLTEYQSDVREYAAQLP